MAKGKNARTSAPKGKPSGTGRETAGLKDAFAVNDPETDKKLEDTYLEDTGDPASNVNLKHQNRNTDKGREQQGEESNEL